MNFEKIKAIIANELNIDEKEITMESSLSEDLGADSLDAVELVMALEDEFGLQVSDEEAQNIHTVGDIVALVDKLK